MLETHSIHALYIDNQYRAWSEPLIYNLADRLAND